MAPRDPAGMQRQRADGSVWKKKPGKDQGWQQLQDGVGHSGGTKPAGGGGAGGEATGDPAVPERADAQWAVVVERHSLDGHVPEAAVHPQHVDTDLEGDTDSKPVLTWTDSAGTLRHSYTRGFHQRRSARVNDDVAQARDRIVAAHSSLMKELGGPRADAAALALAHLHTGHNLEALASGDVYHNRGVDSQLSAEAAKLPVQRSHTADENHPDKIHVALRHQRGHIVLAPVHDEALARHHASGGKHSAPAAARALLKEHGVHKRHQPAVRAHALYHHAADHLSKLPPVDVSEDFVGGMQAVRANVQAVSDHLAEQYGHPPAPSNASYVPPALIAAYVEEAGGSKWWPKAYAAMHSPAPEPDGLLPANKEAPAAPNTGATGVAAIAPVRRSRRDLSALTNEVDARVLANVRDSELAQWATCVEAAGEDWGRAVRLFRSKKYGRQRPGEQAWNSTTVATASSTAPSATSSSAPPDPPGSTPATEEPKSTTPSPSLTPSSEPLAPDPLPWQPGVAALLPRPGGGPPVPVLRSEVAELLSEPAAFAALNQAGARWDLGDARELEVMWGGPGDRVRVRGIPIVLTQESVRQRLCRSFGIVGTPSNVPAKTNIDHVLRGVTPQPEDPRKVAMRERARALYIRCLEAARQGKLNQAEVLDVTNTMVNGDYEGVVRRLTALKAKIQRSGNDEGDGPPPGSAGRRTYQPGETSTWGDGTRHVKEGPGKWKDEPKERDKHPDAKGEGPSVTLQGAMQRLKRLREQRGRTQSADAIEQIDKQIETIKLRIKRLKTNEAPADTRAKGDERTRTARSHAAHAQVAEHFNELAKVAQEPSVSLTAAYAVLENSIQRIQRSAIASFESYCASKPGYDRGVTYLASDGCPLSLARSAREYVDRHGHTAFRRALVEGVS